MFVHSLLSCDQDLIKQKVKINRLPDYYNSIDYEEMYKICIHSYILKVLSIFTESQYYIWPALLHFLRKVCTHNLTT